MICKVSFWSNIKGYGFIIPIDQSGDLFCHHSALIEGRYLECGQMVDCEIGEHRGKRCAKNVRLVGSEGAVNAPVASGEQVNATN